MKLKVYFCATKSRGEQEQKKKFKKYMNNLQKYSNKTLPGILHVITHVLEGILYNMCHI